MPSSHDVISWLDTLQAAWPAGGAAGAAGDAHAQQDGPLHRHWLPGQQEDRRGGYNIYTNSNIYTIYNIYTILYALQVDGWVLLAGLAVLLQQHPPYLTTQLLQRLDQAENSFTLAGDSADLGLVTTFRQHLAQAIRLDDLPWSCTVSTIKIWVEDSSVGAVLRCCVMVEAQGYNVTMLLGHNVHTTPTTTVPTLCEVHPLSGAGRFMMKFSFWYPISHENPDLMHLDLSDVGI